MQLLELDNNVYILSATHLKLFYKHGLSVGLFRLNPFTWKDDKLREIRIKKRKNNKKIISLAILGTTCANKKTRGRNDGKGELTSKQKKKKKPSKQIHLPVILLACSCNLGVYCI